MSKKADSLLELIKTRRSIRRYKDKDVPKEHLQKILEAARWAPSAVNRQPWRFIVIKDEKIKKQLGHNVPVIIAVCAKDKDYKWAPVDCALADQNIMLQAHALGLGTCFIGAFKEQKVKKILDLPEKMGVINLITLGFPNEQPTSTRLELDKITFFNTYPEDKKNPTFNEALNPKSGILSFVKKFINKFNLCANVSGSQQ